MQFINYAKCSTCQKAKHWLDEHHITYTDRPIKEQNPTYEELSEWISRSGLPIKKFFNTSGQIYRAMQLKDKLPEMTEEQQIQLLASEGMLVKRPLLVSDSVILVGFREVEWERLL